MTKRKRYLEIHLASLLLFKQQIMECDFHSWWCLVMFQSASRCFFSTWEASLCCNYSEWMSTTLGLSSESLRFDYILSLTSGLVSLSFCLGIGKTPPTLPHPAQTLPWMTWIIVGYLFANINLGFASHNWEETGRWKMGRETYFIWDP